MVSRATVALIIAFAVCQPAFGQSYQANCLSATTSGDAIINCDKASLLLQQRQMKVLLDIRDTINRNTNRSVAQAAGNTSLISRQLDVIANALKLRGQRPDDFLLVTDLSNVRGSAITCSHSDACDDEARNTADEICRRFGYSGQHAHEFEHKESPADDVQISWVVCRP